MLSSQNDLARFHVRFGWASLAAFATLGAVLEGMHGLKVAWYLEQANETRRLMFTLAHAHGTLLSVVNLVFGTLLHIVGGGSSKRTASRCLLAGTILMPSGFFLGGLYIYGGDPGLGVMLVPVGALCMIIAAMSCALSPWASPPAQASSDDGLGATPSRSKRRKK